MTLKELTENLQKFANTDASIVDEAFGSGLVNLDAQLNTRIFDEHLNSNATKIGTYSTNPTLIGVKSFRLKSNADSFFNSKEAFTDDTQGFRTLKNNKKAFLLIGGYKKLRSLDKLPNNEVTLTRTAEFLKTGIVQKIDNNSFKLVFSNKRSVDIGRGYEKKHNTKVFNPTKKELDNFYEFVSKRILEKTEECLNS